MKRPGNRDYKSVSGYIGDTKPLFEGEDDFIDRREDLVTLRPGRECAWLDAFVERVLKTVRCGPVKVRDLPLFIERTGLIIPSDTAHVLFSCESP